MSNDEARHLAESDQLDELLEADQVCTLVTEQTTLTRLAHECDGPRRSVRRIRGRSDYFQVGFLLRCHLEDSADFSGRLINSQSLGQDLLTHELMISDNGTDSYDSSEKQRIPAWTGEWLQY